MKRVVLTTGLFVAMLPLCAQPRPTDKTVTATAVRDAAGGYLLLHNNSDRPVAAVVYIYTMRNPDFTVVYAATGYYDSAIEPQTQPPIKPGQEVHVQYRIPFSGASPQVGAEAGLFADGSSFGEPHVVQGILDRRHYTIAALGKSIADLKQAAEDGLSRQDLVGQFQKSLMIEASNSGDSELTACIQTVRSQVLEILIARWRRPDGTPVPMPEFLQSQIDALTQRRELLRAAPPK